MMMLLAVSLVMQAADVRLVISDGIGNGALKTTMERSVSELLNTVNRAVADSMSALPTDGLNLSREAREGIQKLWANDRFHCVEEEIVERCLTMKNGYQVRGIPLQKRTDDHGESFQEAVVNFDKRGTITSFYYTINPEIYSRLRMVSMSDRKNEITDINRRMQIIDYVEHFRTSYNQKDLKFLRQVFSEDALIITGSVIKVKKSEVFPTGRHIKYTPYTKKEYLDHLALAFRNNRYIRVNFEDITIVHHPTQRNIYGVTVHQRWNSDRYSDEGYVFMVWDFTDEEAPKIHVRTWQPEFIDKEKGERLPESDVFSLGDFNL